MHGIRQQVFDVNWHKGLSWSDVQELVDKVCAEIILSDIDISCIVGLSRGGLIPAVMIANQLGIREVYSYGLKSYNNEKSPESIKTYQYFHPEYLHGQDILVIDDISDRGESLGYIKTKFESNSRDKLNIHTCTLTIKEHTDFIPTWFGSSIPNNCWVVFPWEADGLKPNNIKNENSNIRNE